MDGIDVCRVLKHFGALLTITSSTVFESLPIAIFIPLNHSPHACILFANANVR